ncbi:hypothetical protein OC846_003462 [Tilletia horrida]|uniref:Saccharopine dehydrogenase NADP binding domain-containing protein n=1 Tax=Tilletia horrida TaxID=155126 RepID=A0AAN6GPF6_9BASI|nr:hypothetical protein OC846_003462 [Tilletia horrida]KAK0566020.1 hypothetical protein OC861_003455 [Tilletia horrida]
MVYDLVVVGASGFVGKLIIRYLISHPEKPTFALSGRKLQKLEALRDEFKLDASVGLIELNIRDEASVQNLVNQSNVIVNLAGPYHAAGAINIIKAVSEYTQHNVGYVDLTGESFAYVTMLKFHDEAKRNGNIIIPSAGFDSIPFDLGVYLGVKALNKALGGGPTPPALEAFHAWSVKGGISKGTICSLADIAEFAPGTLSPHPADILSPIKGGRSAHLIGKLPDKALGKGSLTESPFCAHNGRIVLRSAGLLEQAGADVTYGKTAKFRYNEGLLFPVPALVAYVITFFLGFSTLLMRTPVGRWFVRNVIPDNWGPSEKAMNHGLYSGRTMVRPAVGTNKGAGSSAPNKAALTKISFKGDPGYSQTAKMVVEVALLVGGDRSKLSDVGRQGGIITAAVLGGEAVAERFQRYAGFNISTEIL